MNILFLMEAPLGRYWPYDAQNGIWKVKDGLVSSNTADIHLTHLNNLPVEEFIKIIEKAGKNKKKPASLQ